MVLKYFLSWLQNLNELLISVKARELSHPGVSSDLVMRILTFFLQMPNKKERYWPWICIYSSNDVRFFY